MSGHGSTNSAGLRVTDGGQVSSNQGRRFGISLTTLEVGFNGNTETNGLLAHQLHPHSPPLKSPGWWPAIGGEPLPRRHRRREPLATTANPFKESVH
jgi:hypothetical protein